MKSAFVALSGVLWLLLLPGMGVSYLQIQFPGGGGVSWDLGQLPDGRVPWSLNPTTPPNISGTRPLAQVVAESFQAWENISPSRIAFRRAEDSNLAADSIDGINLFAVGSGGFPTGVLAQTVTTFVISSGRIVDADTLLNPNVPFTTSPVPEPDRFDLQSVAIHEIGHFIGLEHSGVVRSTLQAGLPPGEDFPRTLESDDQIGVSAMYPEAGFLEGRGEIRGTVRNTSGSPIFFAHVVAVRLRGGIAAGTMSNSDGTYRIPGLPPDTYFVYAEPLDGPITLDDFSGSGPLVPFTTTFHFKK